jgi:hypothetical protein
MTWVRHRDPKGYVIAIRRAADAKAGAERIEHTIEHLFEKHAEGYVFSDSSP